MEPSALTMVAEALARSPRVLLLGQRCLGAEGSDNPLFASTQALLASPSPYDWWFKNTTSVELRSKQLADVDQPVLVNEHVRQLFHLPWTVAYTSCVSAVVRRALDVAGKRPVQQIFTSGKPHSAAPTYLPLCRLFGSIDRERDAELPPHSKRALLKRRTEASDLLSPLSEIVGPSGHVFVEGWDPKRDWLKPADLSRALLKFDKNQVFIFGIDEAARESLLEDDYFAQLFDDEIVCVVPETLRSVVDKLRCEGRLLLQDATSAPDMIEYRVRASSPPSADSEVRRPADFASVTFSTILWQNITSSLTIATSLDPTEPLPTTENQRYEVFREFTASGPTRSNHKWLPHLAFRPVALDQALTDCIAATTTKNPEEHVFVAYGQSGAGKTVFVQLLATELRKLGFAVIFAGRNVAGVDTGSADLFCKAIAEASSAPVYLVYDATQPDHEYTRIASQLASRGRRCVVIGTSYQFQSRQLRGGKLPPGVHRARVHPIHLDVRLAPKERTRLIDHMVKFLPYDRREIGRLLGNDVANFFAVLYRLLPEVRGRLKDGLIREVLHGADLIEQEFLSARPKSLQQRLKKRVAEKLDEIVRSQVGEPATDNKRLKHALRLINAVMVASRVRQSVPQTVALRLVSGEIAAYRGAMIAEILEVVEPDHSRGAYIVKARQPLEAEIWIGHRLPNPADQFELIRQMCRTLRSDEVENDHSLEFEFVVKILQAIGPQGDERYRMQAHYREIADLAAEVAARSNEAHPRLVLVECNAIRKWIALQFSKTGESTTSLAECLANLDRAEGGLSLAAERVKRTAEERSTPAQRNLLSVLLTEQSCVLGVKIGSVVRSSRRDASTVTEERIEEANSWYQRAQSTWRRAMQYDSSNARAFDAACWVSFERHKLGFLNEEQEATLLADWNEVMDGYLAIDVSPAQYQKRARKELDLSNALGDLKRFEEVAARLQARGSFVAHSLIARQIKATSGAQAACDYLDETCGRKLLRDRAVLLPYCRLWWEARTGWDTYFPADMLNPRFSEDDWRRLLELMEARLNLEGEHGTTLFLKASALLHLGVTQEAVRLFEHLDRLGVGGFQRSRSVLLVSDRHGLPRQFSAEYQGRRRGGVWLAWCDDLRTNVSFSPVKHGLSDLRPGTMVGPFWLSLGYRGLYAERINPAAGSLT